MIGSAVRARWTYLVPDKSMVQTAFAYEAVMDEVVFMVGPTLVTLLATAVHPARRASARPWSPASAGTLVLAAQRGTEPPRHPRHPDRSADRGCRGRSWCRWSWRRPRWARSSASVEVATVAFSEELGTKSASGPLLATWAFGSLVSGVLTGAVAWRAANASRFRWGMVALAVSVLPLPFLGGFAAMAAVLFVAGFAISPTLIALMALAEEVVPAARLTEGMSIITPA